MYVFVNKDWEQTCEHVPRGQQQLQVLLAQQQPACGLLHSLHPVGLPRPTSWLAWPQSQHSSATPEQPRRSLKRFGANVISRTCRV